MKMKETSRAMDKKPLVNNNLDYFNNEKNEGHIMIKITNENDTKELKVNKNESFAQGIILSYFRTVDDKVATIRKGGIGSTSK